MTVERNQKFIILLFSRITIINKIENTIDLNV